MRYPNSQRAYEEATEYIVGGVNSPSRSFKAVGGGAPVFMTRGEGPYIWDADGNRYIDYLAAYGPLIHGHANAHVAEAICKTAHMGVLFGCPTEYEVQFAGKLRSAIPSMERIRFVNSGTEAVMTCIRVARAYTGRNKILKFAGCYHGHSDLVLVAAGSGPSQLGIPDSAGIPQAIANDVITVPFNNLDSFVEALDRWGSEIAGVLVEPVVGNFGIVDPLPGFLEKVAGVTRAKGALLIFDEVITAFRFRYGAIQDELGVIPDLTAIGKIIGGGLPIGAYGGKQEIMEGVAPLGPTYQAGTMAGNPASILAGIACLEELEKPGTYQRMESLGKKLAEGLLESAKRNGIAASMNRRGGAFSLYYGITEQVVNYEQVGNTDSELFAKVFHALLQRGILIAPSKYEAWFVSTAHTERDIDDTLNQAEEAFSSLGKNVHSLLAPDAWQSRS